MKNITSKIFFLTTLIFISINANAALIVNDWQSENDNLIVYDEATNFEWLNLSATASESYDFVESQLTNGGKFEGFRFATNIEAQNLIANAGLEFGSSCINLSECPDRLELLENFMDIIGSGYTYQTGRTEWGYVLSDNSSSAFADGIWLHIEYANKGRFELKNMSNIKEWNSYRNLGSYLVREAATIPEPAIIMLFCISILGIWASRRNRSI